MNIWSGVSVSVAGATLAMLVPAAAPGAESTKVTDQASAIQAAKRYTKAQCTDTPCNYKARREGKQWNVWVEFTKRASPRAAPKPYPGGHVILYFDAEGSLVRRIQGE